MFEFGRYTLSYQPPEGAVEADVSMSISSEADISEMLRFFEAFLQASGYQLDGQELTLEVPKYDSGYTVKPFTFNDTLFGSSSSDTISFGAANFAGMRGGMSDDVIKF
jgi:hypothetical protein